MWLFHIMLEVSGDFKGKFLPDLFFSLLNQIHQNLIKVVFVAVLPSRLLFGSLHILLVRGAGNVAGVVSQAHHHHLAHSALMSAVPGEKRRERAFNGPFGHRYDLVGFLACRACNKALRLYLLLLQKSK